MEDAQNRSTVEYDSVYCEYDCKDGSGETIFVEESALIEMLADGVLYAGGNKESTSLIVFCNDLFYWASGDGQALPYGQIEPLYRAWKADGHIGVSRWCCQQRGLRPQAPIEAKWREQGHWTDELEALPKPVPS